MNNNTKSNETGTGPLRGDARQVTPAEGKALGVLLEEIGFAPNVMFGRDTSHLPLWFQRLIEGKVYAIVPVIHRGPRPNTGVLEYTLLTAPVGTGTNGVVTPTKAKRTTRWGTKDRRGEWTPERRAKWSKLMKGVWAAKKGQAPKTPQTLE